MVDRRLAPPASSTVTIDEYMELVVLHLEKARDCGEVERIITRSVARLRDHHLPAAVITDYIAELKDGLAALSRNDFDPIHWCNIQYALVVLKNYRS